jgi:3,4-dihydroxy 2-butanone 4-phosphate synthase/GTP cyclohydrolase II
MMNKLKITQAACARIPTAEGKFQLCVYQTNQDHKEHMALILGDVSEQSHILTRIHSECFTGDVLGSLRCDCGEQLQQAMQLIAQQGRGILLYLRQEGRGIGLVEKLRAYNLQDEGYDTVDANVMLGHQPDERDYSVAALILKDLKVQSVQLLTNNPEKIESLQGLGIAVSNRIPLQPNVTAENATYLQTKVQRMNHLLKLDPLSNMLVSPHKNGKNHAAAR